MNRIFQRGIKLSSICKEVRHIDWNHVDVTFKANTNGVFGSSKVENDSSSLDRTKKLIQLERRGDVFHSDPLSTVFKLQPGFDCASLVSAQSLAVVEQLVEEGKTPSYVNCSFYRNVDPTFPIEYHVRDRAPDFVRGYQNGKFIFDLLVRFEVGSSFHNFRMPSIFPNAATGYVDNDDTPIVTFRGDASTGFDMQTVLNLYRRHGYGTYDLGRGSDGKPTATIEFEPDDDDMFRDIGKQINHWHLMINVQDGARRIVEELDKGNIPKFSEKMAKRIREHLQNNYAENSIFEVRRDQTFVYFNMWVANNKKKHFPLFQWIRFKAEIPEEEIMLQRILLMYSMNMPSYETVAQPHYWDTNEDLYTSHQIFRMHRPLKKDDKWLLLGTYSGGSRIPGGRNYNGRIWSEDGELIAECQVFKVPKKILGKYAPNGAKVDFLLDS